MIIIIITIIIIILFVCLFVCLMFTLNSETVLSLNGIDIYIDISIVRSVWVVVIG